MAERDRTLRTKFREREKTFINEQLKRNQELLEILEVMEKEIEEHLLQKVEAFRNLYNEHQRAIKATIQKMDEELRSTLNYREKLWTESLDMVNSNMID